MSAIAKRPPPPGHIRRPPGHFTGLGGQRNSYRTIDTVAAYGERIGVRRFESHDGAPRQRDRQRPAEVVVGVLADQVDPAGRRIADRHLRSRRRAATASGTTSVMKASIADSDAARYFNAV